MNAAAVRDEAKERSNRTRREQPHRLFFLPHQQSTLLLYGSHGRRFLSLPPDDGRHRHTAKRRQIVVYFFCFGIILKP
jgi:hypothetical protein